MFTGNHYVLDAVGGYVALGVGYLAARAFTRTGRHPVPRVEASPPAPTPDALVPTGASTG